MQFQSKSILATCVFALCAGPAAAQEILSNNHLILSVDDVNAYYDIDTTGGVDGDPNAGADNDKTLIYGTGSTSNSAINVDGTLTKFDDAFNGTGLVVESLTNDGSKVTATWRTGDIAITRKWSLVNSTSGNPDMVRMATTVQNTGATNHLVGLFIGIDTMVGDNDGAPLFSGAGIIQTETLLSGSDVPATWQAFENPDVANPGLTAQGVLQGADAVKPDRFLLGNWPLGVGRDPLYTGNGSDISAYNDTAVSMWWDDRPLSPGAALTVVTYYGVGSGTTVAGDLSLNLTGPALLSVGPNGLLTPNPFDINLVVANNHPFTANDVEAVLNLPSELVLISGPTVQLLGDISSSDTALVSWQVEAIPPAPGTGGTADPTDLSEGSPAALAALAFVNDASTTLAVLDVDAALASNAAANIINHRNGPDGVFGTGDDDLFDTIAELDAISFVGPATLEDIATYAIAQGYAQGGGGNAIYTYSVDVTAANDVQTYTATRDVEVPPLPVANLDGLDVTVHTTDPEDFETIEMIVSVNDSDTGEFIDYLDEDNFHVTEDGVDMLNCTVELISEGSNSARADIVFVFDTTGSMTDEIEDLRANILAFSDELEQSNIDYNLGLVTFSESVLGVFGMTQDASEFRSWVQAVQIDPFGGIENPLDAIVEGMNLPLRENSDRIFILATDETYNVYAYDLAQTEQIASGNNVRVHAATLPTLNVDYDPLVTPTGGRFFDLTASFAIVLDDLSAEIINRYLVRCDTPNPARDNTWRDVNVEVDAGAGLGGEDTGTYFIEGGALRIDPIHKVADVGSTFTVDVVADSVSDLQNVHLVLDFDESYLDFVDAVPGELLGRDSSTGPVPSPLVLLGVGHDPATGRIELDVARQVSEGTDGTGVVAQLTFTMTALPPDDLDASGVEDPNQADDLTFVLGQGGVYLENDSFDVISVTAVQNGDIDGNATFLLGDFDTDGDIDLFDFNILVQNWGSTTADLLTGDIGPASGVEPALNPAPDGIVNYHDLFVFTRMYNWYRAQ